MKSICALLLLACAPMTATNQSLAPEKTGDGKAPFTLTISADPTNPALEDTSDKVVAAALPSLRVRKTNVSDHEVVKWSTAVMAYGGYTCEVRDSRGNLVEPRIPRGPAMTSGGEIRLKGTKDMLLQPGESKIDLLPLGNWYDVIAPETYTIQVSSHITNDPASEIVKSNVVKVTVLPAKGKPSAEIAAPTENQTAESEPGFDTSQQPFFINIHANQPQVRTGDPVDINVTLSNFSDHAIDCTGINRLNLDMNYQYEVLDEDGNEAPQIEVKPSSDSFPCTLQPGSSSYFGARLSQLYDFSTPGTYTAQVSRPLESDGQHLGTARAVRDDETILKSNTVTITVVSADDASAGQQ